MNTNPFPINPPPEIGQELYGILGGMGPLATAHFLRRLTELTPAVTDQSHFRLLIYSATHIPDRSSAVMAEDTSPLTAMKESIKLLEKSGVRAIAIPCNTANRWYGELAREITTPIVDIVESVISVLLKRDLRSKRIGLLGTLGTVRSGLYTQELRNSGFDLVVPSPEVQLNFVDAAIKAIKAGDLELGRYKCNQAFQHLLCFDVGAIIIGCTELSLLSAPKISPDVLVIDSLEALAEQCLVSWTLPTSRLA